LLDFLVSISTGSLEQPERSQAISLRQQQVRFRFGHGDLLYNAVLVPAVFYYLRRSCIPEAGRYAAAIGGRILVEINQVIRILQYSLLTDFSIFQASQVAGDGGIAQDRRLI